MKKWLKYTITPILLFICLGANNVKASSATCTFQTATGFPDNGEIEMECYASSENDNVTCKLNSENKQRLNFSEIKKDGLHLLKVSFQDLSENKWKCPSMIYYSVENGSKITYSNISLEGTGNNGLLTAQLVPSKSKDGDIISEVKENIKYCKYDDFVLAINNTTKRVYSALNITCDLAIDYESINNGEITTDNNGCPLKIYQRQKYGCEYNVKVGPYYEPIDLSANDPIFDANGENANGNEENIIDKEYVNSCTDAGETINLLNKIYTLLRYLIPILVIGLSIIDFIKVVVSGDEKSYKNAWNKFIKRIIIGIVILILPALLSLVIRMSGVLETYEINEQNIFCIFQ